MKCSQTYCNDLKINGRGGQIRTDDILLPKQALYQAELRPVTRRTIRKRDRPCKAKAAGPVLSRVLSGGRSRPHWHTFPWSLPPAVPPEEKVSRSPPFPPRR